MLSPASCDLRPVQYEELAEFRYRIRRFVHFSETQAQNAGLEPRQHQALLAIKGAPPGRIPSVGYLAGRLLLKHQSAVGLVDRLERQGLVKRRKDPEDARIVVIRLTARGETVLRRLSVAHRAELERTAPDLAAALRAVVRRIRQLQVA